MEEIHSSAAKLNPLGDSGAQKPCSTFSPCFPQLPVLDEASKHLRLHEDAQETADALGRHGLAKRLPLEDPLSSLVLRDEKGVMSHRLQEEADEGLRHQAAQRVVLCRTETVEVRLESGTNVRKCFSLNC